MTICIIDGHTTTEAITDEGVHHFYFHEPVPWECVLDVSSYMIKHRFSRVNKDFTIFFHENNVMSRHVIAYVS